MSRDATIDWKANLHSIEPELAWSRWEPSAEEPWNMQRAALLFRRAGFGASEEELKKALQESPLFSIDRLLGKNQTDASASEAFEEESAILAKGVLAGGDGLGGLRAAVQRRLAPAASQSERPYPVHHRSQ